MKPIYLDYAATTPVDPQVIKIMQETIASGDGFGNSTSQHYYGFAARHLIEGARSTLADYLSADPREFIWTSGATEANNLAIKGVARLYQSKGKHIVTMKTEHKAVLDPCQYLEKQGYSVTYLSPESNGLLSIEKFAAALRPDTILASIMHVNNETGVVQDLAAIAECTSQKKIFLHVDAVQSIGKIPLNLSILPIDLLSLSAHKIYGPKGIGALYLRKRPRVRAEPLFHGGGQEQGLRAGTLATHQIVGMAEAIKIAYAQMSQDNKKIYDLRSQFLNGLNKVPNVKLNGAEGVPHIFNVQFGGMLADALLKSLPRIATSTASACQGLGLEGSHVLRAMGLSTEEIKSSVRFSLGRRTTSAEITQVLHDIYELFAV